MTSEFYVCIGITWAVTLYACWHIGECRRRLDIQRDVLRKIVEAINGEKLKP
jgi:hypothetical protein